MANTVENQGIEALKKLRGDGQPFLFVNLAVTIASAPDEIRLLLSWFARASKPSIPLPPPPPLDRWSTLYRSHRSLQSEIGATLGFPPEFANQFLDDLRGLHRVPEEQRREEIAELDDADLENFLRLFAGVPFPPDDTTLRAMLGEIEADTDPGGESDADFDGFIASPAGQFYFRVWLPCWLLYREYPPRLLRRARLGDLDALDKLLRLDKSAVHDPVIAERVHQLTHSGTKRDRDLILEALRGKPKGRLDPKTIRYGLAGMISQLAVLFQTRVTAPEIAALFDAIERVRTGKPSDTRIPAGESFAKAVHRNRTWPSLPGR